MRNIRSMYLEDDDQEELNVKLKAKYDRIRKDEQRWESTLTEDADVVVAAFGISARIGLSAVRLAREQGIRAGLFRPVTLFPFPGRRIAVVIGAGETGARR